MAISKSTLLLAFALAFCAAPSARADLVYSITGTYLLAYDGHGTRISDPYLPPRPWIGTIVTDDTCEICTADHGLLSLQIYFNTPTLLRDIDSPASAFASFEPGRLYLSAGAPFVNIGRVADTQLVMEFSGRVFSIDSGAGGGLMGAYAIVPLATPEPGSLLLLGSAVALAVGSRKRLLPYAARTNARP